MNARSNKPPTTYFVPTEKTSPKFAAAFAEGCHGPLSDGLTLQPGAFASFCTPPVWPMLDQAKAEGRDYYYGDHGLWKRGEYYRVTKNAVQYRVTPEDLATATPHRFQRLDRELAPEWRRQGEAIIICPNSSVYLQRFGINALAWAWDVQDQLRHLTDRHTIIRWKYTTKRPLRVDLQTAWMVVVFSSGAAIEALTAGVPVCTFAPWATSAPMGISNLADVESPYYPDTRVPFLWTLANHQWTLAEMAAGITWKALHD